MPTVDELSEGPAAEVVLENAYRKAAARSLRRELPVLGVDTVVSLGARDLRQAAGRRRTPRRC